MSATQQTPNLGLPKFKGSDITSWLGDFNGAMDILDRIISIVYPVGSYYETNDANFNPNTAWKGTTWVEDTSGTVLVSRTETGTFMSVGATGGEEKHTLTTNEMPSHNHGTQGYFGQLSYTEFNWLSTTAGSNIAYGVIKSEGGGQAHNNMPPYTVVKRWRRTA